jgi:hypothetical protein
LVKEALERETVAYALAMAARGWVKEEHSLVKAAPV